MPAPKGWMACLWIGATVSNNKKMLFSNGGEPDTAYENLRTSLLWPAKPKPEKRAKAGGADRDRTGDLMLAKHALSQLSYSPTSKDGGPG